MVRAGVVTDELWELKTALPQDAGRPGRPWNDHRLTLEGIVWRFRTGSPWRDLPAEFGAFQSVWQRDRLWSSDGTHEKMHAALRAQARPDGELDMLKVISIDSTSARAPARGRRPLPRRIPRERHRGQGRITGICAASRLTMRSAGPGAGGRRRSTP
jgi:transposase